MKKRTAVFAMLIMLAISAVSTASRAQTETQLQTTSQAGAPQPSPPPQKRLLRPKARPRAQVRAVPSPQPIQFPSRLMRRMGIYFSLLGDPFPCLIGINLGFNATSYARFTIGYANTSGSVSSTSSSGSATTYSLTVIGGGLKFFVPGWNLSPTVGANYSVITLSESGPPSTNTVDGFSGSGSTVYLSAGLDWQAENGFNISIGFNESTMNGVGGLPYGQIGWFF